MESTARLLSAEEQEPGGFSFKHQNELTKSKRSILLWLGLIPILILTNIMSYIAGSSRSTVEPDNPASYINIDTTPKPFHWTTEYSSTENKSHTEDLWEQIQPSHGFIAVDRTWAQHNGWPESMYLPSDRTKGVYLLEAYHYLHCLKILRKTFWEAVDGKPYTHHAPGAHMNHCFDALRQYVTCNADTTPLYTFGDFTAGDGQTHQCKDWSQVRDYATRNTACYRDSVEHIPLGEHFGFCDDGGDGVIELG
ncbi:hypothetical protein ASPVEDRAFT_154956 [Aspergillus versicolor CBS 583.65]|uniref:Uncharacterized protein n=1 Tax=Aspergillus versicolor CBS 583.65 TaxID=1036611 RepID=A0A1L9Q052_ASPVE|nr:uncharacterized protein ASPVEDRAFT_154956 [Aspergillus versicolor CBS 583.65]OJJ07032.1 hypothetical protein ASPVEDRAFT_154956 [Aspergillus versicolor CBS 583.65]